MPTHGVSAPKCVEKSLDAATQGVRCATSVTAAYCRTRLKAGENARDSNHISVARTPTDTIATARNHAAAQPDSTGPVVRAADEYVVGRPADASAYLVRRLL